MALFGLDELVRLALAEDGAAGDPTSESVFPPDATARAVIAARGDVVVAGLQAARAVFAAVDPGVLFEARCADGDRVAAGAALAGVSGGLLAILRAERPALNFLQRLCGVATFTAAHVARVAGTGCRVADTRKTLPGWRALDKQAVRCGGGVNHRFHLGDGVLLKDNHLAAAGGVRPAVEAARARVHHLLRIEVECDTLTQVDEAVQAGADAVLLDNMSPAQCRDAVTLVAGRAFVEASGGITLANVDAYARAGVDQVSLGALTHSAPAADIGLDLA